MTLWEHKAKIQTDAGVFSPEEASQNFPNGIGQFARPSDKRGVDARRNAGAAGAAAGQRQSRRPRHRRICQRGAALGGRAHAARHSDPDARGSAARLCRARRDQLPAGDRACQHAGTRRLLERVFSVAAREMRARGATLALAPGGRRRPRSALGPDRGDLWRGPLSRQRDGPGGDPRLSGHEACRCASDKVIVTLKHMTGHGQPESGTNIGPAHFGERELARGFLPAVRARGEGAARPLGDGLVQRDRRRSVARQSAGC